MNDKTEQTVTDEPCGTAAGGHAEIINVPGYPLMVRAVDYNTLRAQLAEAQRNAATPTPDAFRKALRLAQRESLDRTGSGVVNWDQADAVMSDEARHLVECYIAAIDAAKGEPS